MITYTEEQFNEALRIHAAQIQSMGENHAKEIAALASDRDRLARLLADASAAFDAGDIIALQKMREDSLKSDKQKALEAALSAKAAAEQKIAELSAQ